MRDHHGHPVQSTGCAGMRHTISRKQQAPTLSKPISFEKAREEGLPHEGLRSATSILISLDFLPCHISRRRLQRDHRSRCNWLHLSTPPCVGISPPSFLRHHPATRERLLRSALLMQLEARPCALNSPPSLPPRAALKPAAAEVFCSITSDLFPT